MVKVAPSADDEPYSILFDVWLVQNLLSAVLDETLTGTGLSGDEFALYSFVDIKERLTPTAISQWSAMRPSTVTSRLRRMTDRGHATTVPNPEDRRSYSVELTPAGRATLVEAWGRFFPVMAGIESRLGTSKREVRRSIKRLDGVLREFGGMPPRPFEIHSETEH
ncbi:MarR family winged helix-turn-helix transcriptional regulator [Mycobacteroides sp. LB1]|uniref:MarR family winged helix-turn-helix transcriptional regulator n=1 Tax=Mycobacteroides sp. LB1 TaxID=2750814 RepID=UPI0015DDBA61|nr:winged helix-turn-helix transcriptional regulator [Mycobacteroides sp. LB1]